MRVLLVDDEALALDRLRTFFADIEEAEVVGQPFGDMAQLDLHDQLHILPAQRATMRAKSKTFSETDTWAGAVPAAGERLNPAGSDAG